MGVVHHDNSESSGAAQQTGSAGFTSQQGTSTTGAAMGVNQAAQFSTANTEKEVTNTQVSQGSVSALQSNQAIKASTAVSSSQQAEIVSGVMTALVPSIEAAVQAALAAQSSSATQQQSTGSSQVAAAGQVSGQSFGTQQSVISSTTTGSQQSTSSFSGSQQTTTASQQISAAEEQSLVLRIIEVLKPSITAAVRKALASRVQTTQVTVNVPSVTQVTSTTTGNQQSSFGSSQQSSFGSSQQSTLSNTQSTSSGSNSASVQGSAVDQNRLVAQIMASLRPSISLSVEQALEASKVTSSQSNFNGQGFSGSNQGFSSSNQGFSSSNQGFSSSNQGFSGSNQGFTSSNQASTSSTSSSQGSSFSSGSSGSVSAESLSDLFGDGKIHTVSVETPLYQIKYEN